MSQAPLLPEGWQSWEDIMELALEQARLAAEINEVPIGAVLLKADGAVLAKAHNAPIQLNDPTAHAEIQCLRKAGALLENYRLCDTILAVTLEPCLMCAGALIHARIGSLVFGACDPKAGAIISRCNSLGFPFHNHLIRIRYGIRAEECGRLLSDFFRARRK